MNAYMRTAQPVTSAVVGSTSQQYTKETALRMLGLPNSAPWREQEQILFVGVSTLKQAGKAVMMAITLDGEYYTVRFSHELDANNRNTMAQSVGATIPPTQWWVSKKYFRYFQYTSDAIAKSLRTLGFSGAISRPYTPTSAGQVAAPKPVGLPPVTQAAPAKPDGLSAAEIAALPPLKDGYKYNAVGRPMYARDGKLANVAEALLHPPVTVTQPLSQPQAAKPTGQGGDISEPTHDYNLGFAIGEADRIRGYDANPWTLDNDALIGYEDGFAEPEVEPEVDVQGLVQVAMSDMQASVAEMMVKMQAEMLASLHGLLAGTRK